VRPGRFDRQVTIELPDREGRKAILELHAKDKPFSSLVDLDAIAGITRSFSGADLANLVNEAALLAARHKQSEITSEVVEEALDRAILGLTSRGHAMTDEERRIVAYHEAGHAMVGRALPGASPPHKLSLASRGRALGFVMHASEHDSLVRTRSQMIDEIGALLGGRAAEQIVFGDPTGGAGDDLQRSSELARRMVRDLGMGEGLGPLTWPNGGEERGSAYSEEVSMKIDAEVSKIVHEAYRRALAVLNSSRADLDTVAETLIREETVSREELEKILGSNSTAR